MPEYERVRRDVEYTDPVFDETQPMPQVERRQVVERETVGADPYVAPDEQVRHREVVERSTFDDPAYRRALAFRKISNVVWSITGLIEALIGLRVLLKLIDANPANGFVDFIYGLSDVFVRPFMGIVSDPASEGNILEVNSLIAMVVYLIVAWAILKLVWLIYDVSEPTRV